MKSQTEIARIEGKIALLNSTINRLYNLAETENRKLNSEEKRVAYGLEQEVKAFEAEITEAPLTVPNSRHNLRGGSGPFDNMGSFFKAVAQAGRPGGQIDPRLYNAATGLGESVPSEGGFLLQKDFSREIRPFAYTFKTISEENGFTI